MLKKQKTVAVAVALLMLALAVSPVSVAAQGPGGGGLAIPISTPDFVGTLTVTSFRLVGGVVTAVGTVVGTALTGPNAGTAFLRQVAIPVIDITPGASCNILNLTLGPLDLDLLGLVVHLDRVVLNITGETGPGNLLGNLLCAIAGLLDPGPGLASNLNQLVALLNRLLGQL
jgi:hypothetical protein